jgi:hypothetical protein
MIGSKKQEKGLMSKWTEAIDEGASAAAGLARAATAAIEGNMKISVLIEGDMLPKRLQAMVSVGSLKEFKAAVANVAKISIDEFDLEVLNTVFGEYCEPVNFGSLGETVKARLVCVAKLDDANPETFAIDPENFNKFQAITYVSPVVLALLTFILPPRDSQLPLLLLIHRSSSRGFFSYGDNAHFQGGLGEHLRPEDLKRSMETECMENDGEYAGAFNEVVFGTAHEESVKDPATGEMRVREQGHDGWKLADFVALEIAQKAKLKPAHVAMIRLYTGSLYGPWNRTLRALTETEPAARAAAKKELLKWATCIAVLYEAVLKLSAVTGVMTVFRGLDESKLELPESFTDHSKTEDGFAGGVEMAFMSTTQDQDIAFQFSGGRGKKGSIIEIKFNAASRGANLQPFSIWPQEQELLFPPFTYLTYKFCQQSGAKRLIKMDAQISTNRPDLSGLDLNDCTAKPETGGSTPTAGANVNNPLSTSPPVAPGK